MAKFYALLVIIFLFFLSLPRLAFAQENILFEDSFSDGNLNNWTIESGNWTEQNGFLRGNQSGRAIGGRIHTGSSEWDNYRLDVDVFNARGIDEGIEFRYKPGGNFYALNLRHGEGLFNTPQIILRKEQDGIIYELTSVKPPELKNNKWYHVTIEVLNENIKVYVNGAKYIDIEDTDSIVKKGTITLRYWTGDIAIADVRFDNVKLISLNPPVPETTPVLLIPGIGGSELKTKEAISWSKPDGHGGTFNYEYPAGEKVWVNEIQAALPGEDDYFDILRMQSDGITPEASLELTGNLFQSAYQPTIDFLTNSGYELNESLFVFPYDWRKDLSLVTPLLDQKIEEIKSQTNSPKVDIIAHSMGGLLARSYISDVTRANKVGKLIELGVSHLGSVESLKYIQYGGCLKYHVGPVCLDLNRDELMDVVQNMITIFQLFPTQQYSIFYTGSNTYPLPFRDDADIDNNGVKGELDYTEIKTLLTNLGHNTNLFNPAENFHNSLGSLDNLNGVDTTIITGSGVPTLGQIIEKNVLNFVGIKINKKDALFINGDKTVPLYSSSLDDAQRNISMNGSAKVFYVNQEHGSLMGNGASMNLVKNILAGNNQIPDGILNQPYKINGTTLSVHSPVNVHVYDVDQNHTGPTESGFEENIQGSSYETLGDAKFIFLPGSGEYLIKFQALDQGSFDFKIRKFENDENVLSILYKNIPLESNTKAKAILNTDALEQTSIEIDENGDETIDQTISPTAIIAGNENFDETSPQVSIDASLKTLWPPNGKMVDVQITGESFDTYFYRNVFTVEDEYALVEPTLTDFNQTIQLQASRREDDMDGRKYMIKVISEDLAGNTSEAKVEVIVPHDQRDKK